MTSVMQHSNRQQFHQQQYPFQELQLQQQQEQQRGMRKRSVEELATILSIGGGFNFQQEVTGMDTLLDLPHNVNNNCRNSSGSNNSNDNNNINNDNDRNNNNGSNNRNNDNSVTNDKYNNVAGSISKRSTVVNSTINTNHTSNNSNGTATDSDNSSHIAGQPFASLADWSTFGGMDLTTQETTQTQNQIPPSSFGLRSFSDPTDLCSMSQSHSNSNDSVSNNSNNNNNNNNNNNRMSVSSAIRIHSPVVSPSTPPDSPLVDNLECDNKTVLAMQLTARLANSDYVRATSPTSPRSTPTTSRRTTVENPYKQHGLSDDLVQNMPYTTLVKKMNDMAFSAKLIEDVKAHRKRLQNRKHVKKYSKKQKHSSIQMQAVTGALEQELINLRREMARVSAHNAALSEQLRITNAENHRLTTENTMLKQQFEF